MQLAGPSLMPPLKKSLWRWVSFGLLVSIIGFFGVSAFHHINQYFELAALDLSKASNRLEAQASLGMIDAVYDLLLHDRLKASGLVELGSTLEVTIFELRLSLAIGVINALLVFAMVLMNRRKAMALLVSMVWVLVMTTALVLASPEMMGNPRGEVSCNCTGLAIIDVSNIWAELARNGAIMIALLWLAYAWLPPRADHEEEDRA